ncbi:MULTISPECIES: type I toxin-antitoxin system Hok family toxin [Enterobacteriaceae]|nr:MULTISPECIES: type I toxin-antitoxin system Hok family toxin [Enterobacteriaceae]MCK1040409.1 type I toxin-antitoxin system Hok family toxin [Escherichia coli]MCV7833275.1 type I toxin-antitoxin system Hok family toxin [Escherichia coli]
MVCLTLLIFTWLTRNSLCELRMKDGTREVFAILAYESGVRQEVVKLYT